MRTYAAALTPPPLPPCTQCVRIGLDPPPCVRTLWMTPNCSRVAVMKYETNNQL